MGRNMGCETKTIRPANAAAWALALVLILGGANPPAQPPPAAAATVPVKPAKIEDFAPPEEFLQVGAVKTHYVHKGERGLPVVLVHGFGGSTFTWAKTIDSLADTHRVYAFDLKGFGLSEKPRDGLYNMDVYTDHLLGFLDELKLEKAVLVGHSLGGAVVTRVALLHPERVVGLVLVAPMPVTPMRDPKALERVGGVGVKSAADKAASLNPKIASRMIPALVRATLTRQTVEAGLRSAYHDPKFITPELVEIYYRPITIEGAAEALATMANAPPAPKPLPPMSTLKIPVLIGWGKHDGVMPGAYEHVARSIPGSKTLIFENSGHIPHEEEAALFNGTIVEFLDGLR